MFRLIVGKLEDAVQERLEARAARNGRSVDAEARAIIEDAIEDEFPRGGHTDNQSLGEFMHAAFKDIVLHGALAPAGMERFDDILSEQDVDNIHAYLIDQSWIGYRAQEAAKHAQPKPPAGGR